jgi:hypothetical protein
MAQPRRKPQPQRQVDPLDLDALKASGFNRDEILRRLLEQHRRGERMDVQRAIAERRRR